MILGALAVAASVSGCASTGAAPRPFPVPVPRVPRFSGSQGSQDSKCLRIRWWPSRAVRSSKRPWRFGEYRIEWRRDRTGSIAAASRSMYSPVRCWPSRGVREQFQVGEWVRPDDLAPGDSRVLLDHGFGRFTRGIGSRWRSVLHAPSSTGVVRVERLSSSYWAPRFLGVRRLAD